MERRGLLLGMLAASVPIPAPGRAAPRAIGQAVARDYLGRDAFMRYDVDPVHAVHYADVATAYGVAQFAEATGDQALIDEVAARHARLIAAAIPNTLNHVDANVYGVWPLELARRTGDRDLLARGLAAADAQWAVTTPDGLTVQARYWIDDVWMIGALQVLAWRATRDARYLDRAALTARLYLAKLQEANGLFHHGRDAPFFWSRGNGWVAAGLAEILSDLPAGHADHAAVLAGYRRMMAALAAAQGRSGLWRQLIDRADSWEESSGSAMFGFAIARGERLGLLRGGGWRRAARRAWDGLCTRVDGDGRLSGVCVGTGQSADAGYYLARPTVTGDLHGQAALSWFAAELARG